MDTEDLKKLWMRSFGDTRRYVDFYFSRRYRPEYTFTATADEKIVSAAQFFPYTVTSGRRLLSGVYILGVCTDPDYRRRGYVDSILQSGLGAAKASGKDLAFLIPQEPWLFEFYMRYGFSKMFYIFEEKLSRQDFAGVDLEGVEILNGDFVTAEAYDFYDVFHRNELASAVLKTCEDFTFALEDLRMYGAESAVCRGKGGKITGFAAYESENGGFIIKELLCTDAQTKAKLAAYAFSRCTSDCIIAYSPTERFTLNAGRKTIGMGKLLSGAPARELESDGAYANLLMN